MAARIPSNNQHLPCLIPGCPRRFKAQNTRTYHYRTVHQNNNTVNQNQSQPASYPAASVPQDDNNFDLDDFLDNCYDPPPPSPSPSSPPANLRPPVNPPPKPSSNHILHPHLDGTSLSIHFYSKLMVSQLDRVTPRALFYPKALPHLPKQIIQMIGRLTRTRFNSDALIFYTERWKCRHLISTTLWKCGHSRRRRTTM